MFSSVEDLRYSCQMALPGFGQRGQEALKNAAVLVVGAGGLGCPVAQYLVAAGVGRLAIADFDKVSVSNLHRQILYDHTDAGQLKAVVAAGRLARQNPFVAVEALTVRITGDNVLATLRPYDVVVDCTDNFATRYLLNDACVLAGKPLVYGAIYQFEGHVAVWNVANPDGTRSPNYRDVFPEVDEKQVPNCAEGGVIPPLAGMIGCMQANEVVKYLTRTGTPLAGQLFVLDALTMESHRIRLGAASAVTIDRLTFEAAVPTIAYEVLWAGPHALVDVRSAQERAAHHIGGLHLPLGELEQHLDQLPAGRPLVFYCASGLRSAQAVRLVRRYWPEADLYSLEGGVKNLPADAFSTAPRHANSN